MPAGIRARDLAFDPVPERDASGRIITNEFLQIPGFEGIAAIGDGALCIQDGKPLPATASVAVQQARYTAERIINPGIKPFVFKSRGDMASLGFMFGVCDIYGWQFRRLIAWIMWKMFKLAMMPRYKNRFQILSDWLIAWVFRRDTSRLT